MYSKRQLDSFQQSKKASKQNSSYLGNARILQKNLVYATNIPGEVCLKKILEGPSLFGQYGKIKTLACMIPEGTAEKKPYCYGQCYVTYEDQRDAALAISGFNGIFLLRRKIVVTQGINRYCNQALKGKACTVKGCYFIHSESECQKIAISDKEGLNDQIKRSQDKIRRNLKYFIQKAKDQVIPDSHSKQTYKSLTIRETLEKLLALKVIPQNQYDRQNRVISGNLKSVTFIRRISQKPQTLTQQKLDQTKSSLNEQTQQHLDQQPDPNISENDRYLFKNVLDSGNKKVKASVNKVNVEKLYNNKNNPMMSLQQQEVGNITNLNIFSSEQENWETKILKDNEGEEINDNKGQEEHENGQNSSSSEYPTTQSQPQTILQELQYDECSINTTVDCLHDEDSENKIIDQSQIIEKIKWEIAKANVTRLPKLYFTVQNIPYQSMKKQEYTRMNQYIQKKLQS